MPNTAHLQAVANSADLNEARRVLKKEIIGLEALSNQLDGTFIRAIDILQAIEGRIVVSGMGKSGHVARKIAATLASTGSPAMFVHPAEASHGDLGMIEKRDAVLALSNSGETVELEGILEYTKRYKIPLIGITSKGNSTLAIAADTAIILPPVGEACPIGLAPMTSTTLMMALGDAIAATLLCRKSFSTTDFSVLHPGGTLGLKLQKISDLMHTGDKLPLVSEATSMSEALVIMTQKSFGCVAVCNGSGQIIGIITDGDLRRNMGMNLLQSDVVSIMTPSPLFISPDALVAEAVHIMNEKKITSLFVSRDDPSRPFTPMGIIHLHDCLRAGQ
jgi:arabinose-5-phosphate isomerase